MPQALTLTRASLIAALLCVPALAMPQKSQPPPTPPQKTEKTATTDNYPIDDLMKASVSVLTKAGFTLNQKAEDAIKAFLVRGAKEYDPKRKAEAVSAATKFGQTILGEAQKSQPKEPKAPVTSSAVQEAASGICPLWPFCK